MYPKTVYLPITIGSAEQLRFVASKKGWVSNPQLTEEENLTNAEAVAFAAYRQVMVEQLADPFIQKELATTLETVRQQIIADAKTLAEQAVGQPEE